MAKTTLQLWLGKQDAQLIAYVSKMRMRYGMSESETLRHLLNQAMNNEPLEKELREIKINISEIKDMLQEDSTKESPND